MIGSGSQHLATVSVIGLKCAQTHKKKTQDQRNIRDTIYTNRQATDYIHHTTLPIHIDGDAIHSSTNVRMCMCTSGYNSKQQLSTHGVCVLE